MKPYAERWFEGCSKKRSYSNELLAHRVAAAATKERGIALRVYKCEFCPNWHMTKKAVQQSTHNKEMNV